MAEMKVALCGDFYAGKSTLACTLGERGWTVLDHTGLLKRLASDALRFTGKTVSVDELNRDKPRYRSFLKEFGSVIGWDEGFGVERCIDEWTEQGRPVPVVLDNVRNEAQWRPLERLGFTLVRLVVPGHIIEQRARDLGVSRESLREMLRPENSFRVPHVDGEISLDCFERVDRHPFHEDPLGMDRVVGGFRQFTPDEVATNLEQVLSSLVEEPLGVGL